MRACMHTCTRTHIYVQTHTHTCGQIRPSNMVNNITRSFKEKSVKSTQISFVIQLYSNVLCILFCIQDGDTPLYIVCKYNYHDTVDLLVKAGANPDIANNVSFM